MKNFSKQKTILQQLDEELEFATHMKMELQRRDDEKQYNYYHGLERGLAIAINRIRADYDERLNEEIKATIKRITK